MLLSGAHSHFQCWELFKHSHTERRGQYCSVCAVESCPHCALQHVCLFVSPGLFFFLSIQRHWHWVFFFSRDKVWKHRYSASGCTNLRKLFSSTCRLHRERKCHIEGRSFDFQPDRGKYGGGKKNTFLGVSFKFVMDFLNTTGHESHCMCLSPLSPCLHPPCQSSMWNALILLTNSCYSLLLGPTTCSSEGALELKMNIWL